MKIVTLEWDEPDSRQSNDKSTQHSTGRRCYLSSERFSVSISVRVLHSVSSFQNYSVSVSILSTRPETMFNKNVIVCCVFGEAKRGGVNPRSVQSNVTKAVKCMWPETQEPRQGRVPLLTDWDIDLCDPTNIPWLCIWQVQGKSLHHRQILNRATDSSSDQ